MRAFVLWVCVVVGVATGMGAARAQDDLLVAGKSVVNSLLKGACLTNPQCPDFVPIMQSWETH